MILAKRYQVVSSSRCDHLAGTVDRLMSEGWRPQGGIFHKPQRGSGVEGHYYQAMVMPQASP